MNLLLSDRDWHRWTFGLAVRGAGLVVAAGTGQVQVMNSAIAVYWHAAAAQT